MDDVSCIGMNHPEVNIVVNDSNEPKEFPVKESVTGKSIILTPGVNQVPSNMMREPDFDAKSFPLKHQSGKYALNFPRLYPISKQQYFRLQLFQ